MVRLNRPVCPKAQYEQECTGVVHEECTLDSDWLVDYAIPPAPSQQVRLDLARSFQSPQSECPPYVGSDVRRAGAFLAALFA